MDRKETIIVVTDSLLCLLIHLSQKDTHLVDALDQIREDGEDVGDIVHVLYIVKKVVNNKSKDGGNSVPLYIVLIWCQC